MLNYGHHTWTAMHLFYEMDLLAAEKVSRDMQIELHAAKARMRKAQDRQEA